MDPDELRQAFIEEAREIEVAAHVAVDLDGLAEQLYREARSLSAAYRATANPERRHALEALYRRLDKCVREVNRVEKMPEGSERRFESKAIAALAEEVLDVVRRDLSRGMTEEERIDTERRRMLEKQKAGAGANTFTRLRNEIEYLVANYVPANDARIEMLIDQWRRSGDPNYSPEIRVKFLEARKKRDSFNYPI